MTGTRPSVEGDGALFAEEDAFDGDPLRPDMKVVTPASLIARLTARQREQRVEWLIQQAHDIYLYGVENHLGNRHLAASVALYSGGNDSTVLTHLMRSLGLLTHAVHANTTIGIEQTRQFVRDTCTEWGLPLIEKTAPIAYRDLVIERGFPGPGMHWKMFTRLKERALDAARAELGIASSRSKAAVFVAGRRRSESERRKDVPLWEPDGSVIWVSPIAMWTKLDLTTYRLMHDVPVNEVSNLIHMSGECLCGAFAKPGELDEIGYWFPEVKAEIEALQREVAAAGHEYPFDTWGHGQGAPSTTTGRLCTSCQLPGQTAMFTESDGAAA